MKPNLTIQIVGWNSAGDLEDSLSALRAVPEKKAVIRYIDNGSNDGSVDQVRKLLPRADILEMKKNSGFAGAHNTALKKCTTPLVMTHDPDLVISWAGVEELIKAFADEEVGAVQGKIYRSTRSKGGPSGIGKESRGRVIDSAGIELTWALNGRERGANEIDEGQYDKAREVQAVTGAAGIFRLAALQKVKYGEGEFFDNDFFSYKEDVDLGWRLRKAGWKVRYLPIVEATHKRTLGKRGVLNWGLSPKGIYLRLNSKRTRYSLRNWVWMILKNVTFKQELKHEIFVDIRLLFFFSLSLIYWPLFSVWGEIIKGLPGMMKKRKMNS